LKSSAADVDFTEEEKDGDEERLVVTDGLVNVDAANEAFMARSHDVWESAERSRWLHNLNAEEGFAPDFRHQS
jgi:hypothetical protein